MMLNCYMERIDFAKILQLFILKSYLVSQMLFLYFLFQYVKFKLKRLDKESIQNVAIHYTKTFEVVKKR